MKQEVSSSRPSFFTFLFATGIFSGYAPFASGTFGSLVGIGFFFIPHFEQIQILIPAIILFLFIGVFVATKVSTYLKDSDPSVVVIDEIVGMWISCSLLPKTFFSLFLAFVLFRVFDIWKPFPVRQLEYLRGGWGIMLDDVAAGLYANIIARIILTFVQG